MSSLNAKPPADLQAHLDAWVGREPGGVALAWVDADGSAFFQSGRFDGADSPAITADTAFETGSVTKVFTALLLADTVRAGKVALEDTVGAPFAPSQVTYRQLATHTSGLPRMPADFSVANLKNPYRDESLARLVKSFDAAAGGLKPAPSAYSNFGFAVLGQAVAGAWGRSYSELLTERVLQPLGMADARFSWREVEVARLAPGHTESGAFVQWDLNAFAPAGALVASSRDLAKLVQAGLGFTPTSLQAALADTMQPQAPGDVPARQVGLGWQIEPRGAATLVWHNGATGGYHSLVILDPGAKTGLVLLANRARELEPLGFALQSGQAPVQSQLLLRAAESVQEFIGNYPFAPSFVIAVTAEGEQLFLQATNQPRFKLTQVAVDHYAVAGVAAEISFERDAGSRVTALILHQNGRDQRAAKAK